jgi:hypothetical protein
MTTLNRRQTLAYFKERKANLKDSSYFKLRLSMDRIQLSYLKLDLSIRKAKSVRMYDLLNWEAKDGE